MKENFEKQLLRDLFRAYFDARKNKRNSLNALEFEIDYESKLLELYKEIKSGNYKIGQSTCFISSYPVKREVFAANFRDRIVHHLIYNYISPFCERLFVNDSYSCRLGKGTSYGIARVEHFIRSCSENYSRDCYILKLDIKGYFMAIERSLLYKKVEKIIYKFEKKCDFDINLVLWLIKKVIFNDPTKNCRINGKKEDWEDLPKSKSLFYAGENKGMPIGNLTSQLFGNIYLNDFDHFVKHDLKCKYYGRYVDDIVIVHQDKNFLKKAIVLIKNYLKENLYLELHPNKIYFQYFPKGVRFLGVMIKPHRNYIGNKIKGNFYKKNYELINSLGEKSKLTKEDVERATAYINSYLGIMKNYQTFKLRKKIIGNLQVYFKDCLCVSQDYGKVNVI